MTQRAQRHEVRASWAAVVSGCAAIIAAGFGGYTSITASAALKSSERISTDNERAAMFAQFQDKYNDVSARFPARVLDPKFQPKPGSEDYVRLEAYWFFCFSEWYETNRVNSASFGDLWSNYYTPLVTDGLEIPSLRYVLQTRVRTRGPGKGQWHIFLRTLARLASADKHPFDSDVVKALNGPDQ